MGAIKSKETEAEGNRILRHILSDMAQGDEGVNEDFDPVAVVGELKDKIDSIHYVMTRLESRRDEFKKYADIFTKAARTVDNNINALKDYCSNCMESENFEQLPGTMFKMRLIQRESISQRPVTPKDYLEYPDLVERNTVYKWNTSEIKKRFEAQTLANGIAEKKVSKFIRFYTNTERK